MIEVIIIENTHRNVNAQHIHVNVYMRKGNEKCSYLTMKHDIYIM